ncbi:MAG TPA: DUF4258 domain-containing protein [Flavitalea sp.]|nr:DUF4258 domain-containing protein [Flavitalea sp.]
MQNRRNRAIPGLIILIIGFLVFRAFHRQDQPVKGKLQSPVSGSLNRDKNRLTYTRHARCRMACRQVDSSEVIEILEHGSINYKKTDTTGSRDPKFALEGQTDDGQHVRIVFAMAGAKTVVVTVIDLDQNYECDCP